LKEILKRLEMIKSAVSIGEDEIISLQIVKLKTMSVDGDVQKILELVDDKSYEEVISRITEYIDKFSGMVLYEDSQVQGLKVELSVLEKELNSLSEKKNEYISEINAFNAEYYKHLGAIIEEILRLKREYAERLFAKGELNADELEDTKEQYEEFYKQALSQAKEQPHIISQEDEKKLKKLYKKASRLTHPDVVADEFKAKAAEIFNKLNHAYKTKDLDEVERILKGLESDVSFFCGSEKINDKEVLREKSKILRAKIQTLKDEIASLKDSETYQTIQNTKNLDKYFKNLKEELEYEKRELEREMQK